MRCARHNAAKRPPSPITGAGEASRRRCSVRKAWISATPALSHSRTAETSNAAMDAAFGTCSRCSAATVASVSRSGRCNISACILHLDLAILELGDHLVQALFAQQFVELGAVGLHIGDAFDDHVEHHPLSVALAEQ